MKKNLLCCALLSAMGFAQAALAQDEPLDDRWYVTGAVGAGIWDSARSVDASGQIQFGVGRYMTEDLALDLSVHYANPEFDRLLEEAMAELDPPARAAIYARAQQLLIDDVVVIPTYHDVGYWLAKPWVKGVELTALGLLQLETIWIER